MTVTVLRCIYRTFLGAGESFTKLDKWPWLLSCLLPISVLFFAFPSYERLNTEFAESWRAVQEQAAHPLAKMQYAPDSHQAKMTFRLTVPVMAKVLHLDRTGILVLQAMAGVLLFYLAASLFLRITHDKVSALFLTLSFSFIYAGRVSFTEIRGIFDGVALVFLVSGMAFRHPLLVFTSIFLTSWTDERGLIASSLVFVFWAYWAASNGGKVVNSQTIAVVLAWAAYFATRYFLARKFGLVTHPDGVGLRLFIDQTNNLPMGVWSALEGGWLLVLAALYALWQTRKPIFTGVFAGGISMILFVAMCVVDITRSMAYVLPALFLAVLVIKELETPAVIRKLVVVAMVVSFVYPAYYTGGDYYINWTYPLPLQLLRYAFAGGS